MLTDYQGDTWLFHCSELRYFVFIIPASAALSAPPFAA
jgi:hypothetical protein